MKLSKIIFLFFLWIDCFAANQYFNGAFYSSTTNDASWVRNGSTLDLDFVNNRYFLNGTTYSTFNLFLTAISGTYSRGSTAYYYNSSGTLTSTPNDVPRFDYDPYTREPKGILIEEARTNSYLYSSQINQASWNKSSAVTVTADSTVAPDGTNTADTITASGTGLAYIQQNVTFSAGSTVSVSLYVKAGTSSKLYIEAYSNGVPGGATMYDLAAQTVTPAGTGVTASMQKLSNNWFRVIINKKFTNDSTLDGFKSYFIDTYGTAPVGKSLIIWGAQWEIGPSATSHIPTTNVTESRSADIFSLPTSAWYTSTLATFYAETYFQLNTNQTYYARAVGGDGNKSFVGIDNRANSVGSWNGTTSLFATGTVTPNFSQYVKLAHAWDSTAGTQTVAVGSAIANSASFTGSWASTYLYPGGSAYNPLNASLRRITYFPYRFSDAVLKDYTR